MKASLWLCVGVGAIVSGCHRAPPPSASAVVTGDDVDAAVAELEAAIRVRKDLGKSCRDKITAALQLPEPGRVKSAAPTDAAALRGTPYWAPRGFERVVLDSPFIAAQAACHVTLPAYAEDAPIKVPPGLDSLDERLAWAKQELVALGPVPTVAPPERLVVERSTCKGTPKKRYVRELVANVEGADRDSPFSLDAFKCVKEIMWVSLSTHEVLAAIVESGSATPEELPADVTQDRLSELNDETQRDAAFAAHEKVQASVQHWKL